MPNTFAHLFGADGFPRRDSVAEAPLPPLRAAVLVVDPHELVREVMVRALRMDGYTVYGCGDARQASALFEIVAFTGCVVDQALLGDVDGVQLLRWIRRREAGMPVVLTSGMADHDFAELLRGDPALRYLAKPFGARKLVDILGRLIKPGGRGATAAA